MTHSRLKVLLLAYGCSPDEGSEGGVGWNWARQITRFHDVWILTQTKYHARIAEAIERDMVAHTHVLSFDLPLWVQKLRKGRWENCYYPIWELGAYFVARRAQKRFHFDIVHHVSLVRYWMPSIGAFLSVPFVWGPVGGADAAPSGLAETLTLQGRLLEFIRRIAIWAGELNPLVHLTARRANLGLATTQRTLEQMQKLGCRRVQTCTESALPCTDLERLSQIPLRSIPKPFRILSVGRLVHLKAFELSMKAVAEHLKRHPDSEYWIAGEGPERDRLVRLSTRLGIRNHVRFLGSIPHTDVFAKLAQCDVLIHPSLRESGGWVCIEAMATGRPVICLDWAGPGIQVNAHTGFKVPPASPSQVIEGMAAALEALVSDAPLRKRMGEEGRRRVLKEFEWNRKGDWMATVYDSVVSHNAATMLLPRPLPIS